ncbi:hypothetical protein, partial [Staphylococcus haemolyticus]|uniref:hypothetical protein n=1 Tax=Staphylococcus haemolyticus TaxID=1283 RepID=UPI0015D6DB11
NRNNDSDQEKTRKPDTEYRIEPTDNALKNDNQNNIEKAEHTKHPDQPGKREKRAQTDRAE